MTTTVAITPDDCPTLDVLDVDEVLLVVSGQMTKGRPMRPNWGGLPDPAEPPEFIPDDVTLEDGTPIDALVEMLYEAAVDKAYEEAMQEEPE